MDNVLFLGDEVVMQRGWLLLGLALLAYLLYTAPALASKEPEGGEGKKHATDEEKVKKVKEAIDGGGEPKDVLEKVDKALQKEEHAEESNIFKGFIDLSVWTIVVFVVLFFVLKKWAWGPMLQGLQERERSIHSAMDEAKAAKEEATKLRAELQTEIAKARSEAQALRDEARRDAERLREEINAKAKAEREAERDRVSKEIENARMAVLQELMAQTAQLSTMIASKAVRRQITIEDQNRLVDEALADFRGAAGKRRSL
jgi:F-type H+-transporting ATPase subunit b